MTAGSGIQSAAGNILLRSLTVGAVYAALHALIPEVLRVRGALLPRADAALVAGAAWVAIGLALVLALLSLLRRNRTAV